MSYILISLLASLPLTRECAPLGLNIGQDMFLATQPTLGIPIQTYGPYIIRGVGTENIEDVDDLYCQDFGDSCQWFNVEGADIPWLVGKMQLDGSHMKIATGTEILPEVVYAIAITDQQKVPDANAVLASRIINCQSGYGQLRFKYWVSSGVEIEVCAKRVAKAYPEFEFCTDVDIDETPGPAYVNVKDFDQQPFQMFIRAKNFIFNTPLLKGGFAIIDDIEYHADLCADLTKTKKNERFPFKGFHLADSVIPSSNITDNQQIKNEKEYLFKKVSTLIPPTAEMPRPQSVISNPVDILSAISSPQKSIELTTEAVETINENELPNAYESPSEAVFTTKYIITVTPASLTRVSISPKSACSALNCSFNNDICKQYLEGTGWKATNKSTALPSSIDNRDSKGFFAYVSGPVVISRWTTTPFIAPTSYRLSFSYIKVSKRAKFRVLSRRIGNSVEERIFQAPRLRNGASTWRSAEILLYYGSYEYVSPCVSAYFAKNRQISDLCWLNSKYRYFTVIHW